MFMRLFAFAATTIIASNVLFAQNNNEPHLYFFTNPGCGPCKQVEPEIQRLISKGYPVSIVDTVQRPDIAREFNVDRTPTTILVSDDRIAGRHAGLIDAHTIVGWFQAALATRQAAPVQGSLRTKPIQPSAGRSGMSSGAASNTMHRGTRKPKDQAEFEAMRATVRLIVSDGSGESVGTGTIIHSQDGECLVLTCGHMFRRVGMRSKVTADIGFETNETRNVPGRLISFDAESKDIALVVLQTGIDLPAVPIAPASYQVSQEEPVFTLGCDLGQDATIRRTRIIRQSRYGSPESPRDFALKFDIYGRSVVGRSGGGMFTTDGRLIGVGNAAAVEVDEGIYSALENIHWQLAEVNLAHLFRPGAVVAKASSIAPNAKSQVAGSQQQFSEISIQKENLGVQSVEYFSPGSISHNNKLMITLSSIGGSEAETLIVNNPSNELLAQLDGGRSHAERVNGRLAQLRQEMPLVGPPSGSEEIRAQSFR